MPDSTSVAAATVCARFGLDCVVYMGAEDMERQRPNVERMHLLGAEVRSVEFGTRTLKEATSEAIRDWITNVATTHYLIGSCVGPHPYPEIVRELQAVIGREAREQILEAEGTLPDAVVACVGGGSNAIGLFAASWRTRACGSQGVEAAARQPGSGRAACCTGRAPRSSPTRTGRSPTPTRSRPGSTTRAWARSTRSSATGAGGIRGATDEEALAAFRLLAEREGIIPALDARARALELDGDVILVGLSGRGDSDLGVVLGRALSSSPST